MLSLPPDLMRVTVNCMRRDLPWVVLMREKTLKDPNRSLEDKGWTGRVQSVRLE